MEAAVEDLVPKTLKRTCVVLLGCVVAWSAWEASAQAYPSRPIRIVTSAAGNFHDVVARALADQFAERWKQAVVVENRPGAAGSLAVMAITGAAPDGHTLVVADRSALAVTPVLNAAAPFDVGRDLTPIALLAASPMYFVVSAADPVPTVREFIARSKRQPQPVHLASAGPGTAPHLVSEVLRHASGANVAPVHYKGSPASMTGLLAGETSAGFVLVSVALPHVRSGKVRALAITSAARFPGTPEVPTVIETGLPELESALWLALMAPARTPPAIVEKLAAETREVMGSPRMLDTLRAQGALPDYRGPLDLAGYIRSETDRMRALASTAGLRLE